MRMRKKKNLGPRMARCAAQLVSDPCALSGRWRTLMPGAQALRLELGCGKGRFTVETAKEAPDVLFVAVELVPDAMVVAMERCKAEGLANVFFVDGNADQLPTFFQPGEVDRIYINFCDPWPSKRHAKRRLTHGNFLKLYRKVLCPGGQIHFKTDNAPLFAFSVEEIPQFGFSLSEVTDDLHQNGPTGVMTDYEAKFHALGTPIHRLVATMEADWQEVFPTDIRAVRDRWLDVFAAGVSEEDFGRRVQAEGNYLWHIFSWKLAPCLEGAPARQALTAALGDGCFLFYYEYPPEGVPRIQALSAQAVAALPDDSKDWYLVDKDFTWTYVHTHESGCGCGPFFCRSDDLAAEA